MDSHAAAMIKRFREGKPMSRAERDKFNKGVSEMWWIENPQDNRTLSRTDESEQPRNSSPMKPTARHDLWDPIKSPVPARRNESWRKPMSPPRRATHHVDDLISDEIEDDFLSRPTVEFQSPSYARRKLKSSYENPVDLLGSLRFSREERAKPSEEKSYRFRTSLRFEDDDHDLDVYRSLEKNRQLSESVETFGAMGFKSLLAPNLKLDGKSDPPPTSIKQEGHELAHLTNNLETLLRSFKIDRPENEVPLTEYEVPQSISQVTNQLNSDMLTFMSQYSTKYSQEEELEKQQKERDVEMKKLGQQEAELKLMLDREQYNLLCEAEALELHHHHHLSSDEKILQEIEQNIQRRRLLSSERKAKGELEGGEEQKERKREEEDDRDHVAGGNDLYRHHLYHRPWNHPLRSRGEGVGLSELSSHLHLQRAESLYLLHNHHRLDPLNKSRQMTMERGLPSRYYPQPQDLNDKYEEEEMLMPLTGIDVLSSHSINHRSITTAARDTISCCLNATMNTLALRLPGEEEILRQTALEDERKQKYLEENEKLNEELSVVKAELLRKEQELLDRIKELNTSPSPQGGHLIQEESPPSSPSPSSLPLELVNHVKEEDLKKIEELLGPEEKESELLTEVLKKKEEESDEEKLSKSQRRHVYFQSTREIEEKIARRGDDSRRSIQRYVYPSRITGSSEKTPKPSAPELPLEEIPSPPSVASSRSDPQTIPRYEREAYLQKMKSMRQKMMAS
jgi:hypothetical protein